MRPSRSSRKWHAAWTDGRTESFIGPQARCCYPLSKFPRLEKNEMNAATILKFKGSGVVTTTANKSLLDIAKLLAQHRIGCIVILGDDDKIAGIVSERDLMRAIGHTGPKVLNEPVSDFMTKTVVTARGGRHERPANVGNDDAPVPPHARGGAGPADWPRLHRRPSQDADRGSRDGGGRDAGVRRLLAFEFAPWRTRCDSG